MDQHKLYRTIKLLTDAEFRTEEQLLAYVLERIIQNQEFPIKGGRIWKLDSTSGEYRLLRQYGEIELISRNFRIRVRDYPLFVQLPKKGTIITTETNTYLRRKGISHYSATGVGEHIRWKGNPLYQYVIAINAEYLRHDMLYALNIIGVALTTALKNRRSESKAKQLERDLDKAREIQRSILPEHEMTFHNYDLYGISLAERVVGGDFFDYLQTPEDTERLGVVVGDATSKGLSAAAQALYVSGALRMGIQFNTKINTLISKINQLVNRTFTTEHFISMVYAEFTATGDGLVSYVNAGHSTPILLRGKTEEAERLPATGQILGPFPREKYGSAFTIMKKGDILLLYTDGIVEASNERHEMFGEERLVERLRHHKTKTPKQICQQILEDVQIHNRLEEHSDDKTIVVVKRTR
ncbi:MAG: PP2C family protein-serine/threonine phosphatase [Candidatus Eisenbacteria bacterium]|nr:PP2C family protein-serine/threonine phosphatase [Candidatus Eisenbacteria bacterium]